ncbi:MAG: bifunctional lysine ketoglutarate reductase /saccharopine dehydrogenase family protein [Candidatus Thermoplasmatota archaeon]|nr:bifunctional lysine ketoglutarate reductase /saccharopine dehydrogenase family protein [Candidatus Thermoplasmatota archaeon]
MPNKICIRKETKNRWERRTPLTPDNVLRLRNDQDISVAVEPSDLRVFPDEEYSDAGAELTHDLSGCDIILGIKEVPIHDILEGKTYLFFSHTIKGQKHNMRMLEKLVERKCTLIDYERITDERNRRLIFFGWHAGAAGVIDTLWAAGRRLEWEGVRNPFSSIMTAHEYSDLQGAREHMAQVGRLIATYGIPYSVRPFVVGITGTGNVSRGAQEMLDLLPVVNVKPEELPLLKKRKDTGNVIYKVVFEEKDMYSPVEKGAAFDLQDYYDHPQGYMSRFIDYVPYMSAIINCVYWDPKYPRLLTKTQVKDLYSGHMSPKLRVIGDISCDIEGSMEVTIKPTIPDSPVFIYDPWEDKDIPGWKGTGPVVMAVENLPAEIPLEASEYFGGKLMEFIPFLANAAFDGELKDLKLPKPLMNALILFKGDFTESYRYMEDLLNRRNDR